MAQRHIFFLIDKLRVSRAERITVATLMFLAAVLLSAGSIFRPAPVYTAEYYAQSDSIFLSYQLQKKQFEREMMARYQPSSASDNTFPAVTLVSAVGSQAAAPSRTPATASRARLPAPASIEINQSSVTDFARLPGVGPKTAALIVEYRNKHGPFTDLSQIRNVKGIGPKKWQQIHAYLRMD